MIKGYFQISSPENAILLYKMLEKNVKPDDYTFPSLFKGFNRDVPLDVGNEYTHIYANFVLIVMNLFSIL